jgi:DNA-binding winged helix-turn-helix (wHTH) protein
MSLQGKHFYQFGPFSLDPVKRRLKRDGEVVKLTPKAFETLLVLVAQRGKTIEKDELLNKVWAGAVVEENNLNQCITALRKSLGDSRQESQYIATIPALGIALSPMFERLKSRTVPPHPCQLELTIATKAFRDRFFTR